MVRVESKLCMFYFSDQIIIMTTVIPQNAEVYYRIPIEEKGVFLMIIVW